MTKPTNSTSCCLLRLLACFRPALSGLCLSASSSRSPTFIFILITLLLQKLKKKEDLDDPMLRIDLFPDFASLAYISDSIPFFSKSRIVLFGSESPPPGSVKLAEEQNKPLRQSTD